MSSLSSAVPATAVIPLGGGLVTIIDEVDLDRVMAMGKWGATTWQTTGRRTFYARGWDGRARRKIFLHRFILSAPDGTPVDHRNHDGLDNRRSNLRLCTIGLNNANRQLGTNSTSGYKGVSWDKHKRRWRVALCVNGRSRQIGRFVDAWEAAEAYNAAALEQWGEYASLNVRHT